jgi:phosphoketolase
MNTKTLSAELRLKIDAYWRAANYLSVAQIYLFDNPLLKRPLALTDIKKMLLGHWGTTPGQNFIYVHLNRVINKYDLNMIYVSGPGHGGPAVVSCSSSSRFPAASPAMPRRNVRARFMRAVSWDIRSAIPSARYSTIPI